MEMHNENEGYSITGFIEEESHITNFPVVRTIRMKVYSHNGKKYVRTRDAADLLGMKQPFQFTANCRKYLGEGSILNDAKTEAFRSEEDSSRVTFIEISDLLDYLLYDGTNYLQNYEKGMYTPVVSALQAMVNK